MVIGQGGGVLRNLLLKYKTNHYKWSVHFILVHLKCSSATSFVGRMLEV